MIAFKGALLLKNLSSRSFISNTTDIEIIRIIENMNVPKNFFIMYLSSIDSVFILFG